MAEPAARPDRPYPETWMIPQFRTEAILREKLAELGVEVEFGVGLRLLRAGRRRASLSLWRTEPAPPRRRAAATWWGRTAAAARCASPSGIAFEGETREEERYLIADVEAAGLDHRYWHNWSIDGDGVRRISMCPLPQTDSFQLVAPLEPGAPAPELTLATLQQLVDARAGAGDLALAGLSWITLHRTNLRLAASYRRGSVFLVGDAAHSPPQAGGQGLNISVQDAWNLGWKLGATLRGAGSRAARQLRNRAPPFRRRQARPARRPSWKRTASPPRKRKRARRKSSRISSTSISPIATARSSAKPVAHRQPRVSAPETGRRMPGSPPRPGPSRSRLFDLFRGPQLDLARLLSGRRRPLRRGGQHAHRESLQLVPSPNARGRQPRHLDSRDLRNPRRVLHPPPDPSRWLRRPRRGRKSAHRARGPSGRDGGAGFVNLTQRRFFAGSWSQGKGLIQSSSVIGSPRLSSASACGT